MRDVDAISICKAIRELCVLELRYHNYLRLVEPHAYGTDRKGKNVLRCYQISDGSERGESVGWKILKTDDIQELTCMESTFSPRADYRRGDKAMTVIHREV